MGWMGGRWRDWGRRIGGWDPWGVGIGLIEVSLSPFDIGVVSRSSLSSLLTMTVAGLMLITRMGWGCSWI